MAHAAELRVLLRTATARDATMATAVLERAGLESVACIGFAELADELALGAGALLLSEEVLRNPDDAAALAELLSAQPPWSDLPVLVLARQGADSPIVNRAMEQLLNVTVIERPVRVAALVSALRSALRARRRQYELRELFESLRLADQRKTEFLATLAHELRNPLAPLLTALALMRRKNGAMEPPEREHYFDLMGRQIDHMTRLVDDLMEVSRITRGRIELHMQVVALESVLKDAIEQSRPLVKSAGHALNVQLPGPDLVVRGDPLRLTQVFANLINNAAKYTLPGGRLGVVAREDGDEAVVEVSDSGVGIAPDMLDSVFEMFVQASGTAKAAQGGLGIGLTLVRSLVGLHGGSVRASSAGIGHGTTMRVRLPLLGRPSAPPPPEVRDEPSARAEGAASAAPLAGRALLVVDDNRDAADTLAELLAALGARVRVAYSGEEALRVRDEGAEVCAAILDLGMPGMDGYELARRLREREGGATLRLIAMTGWGQPSDRERVKAAGFDHHLLKPMDVDALIGLL